MTINPMHDDDASLAFSALGNSTRLALFRLLVKAGPGGLNVGEIQANLGIPASTLAHHLAGLKTAGLIVQTRQGREIVSEAKYAAVDDLIAYLTAECCSGVSKTEDEAA